MDCMKAETDVDDETGMVFADSYYDLIDVKEEVDPVLKFPAVKSESQVSCVFLVRNIYLT
jgi:hypothetical protein